MEEEEHIDVYHIDECNLCGRRDARRWYMNKDGPGRWCVTCYRRWHRHQPRPCHRCHQSKTRLFSAPVAYGERWCRNCMDDYQYGQRYSQWRRQRCARCQCLAPGSLTPGKLIETDLWCPTCHAYYDFFYNMTADEFDAYK